MHHTFLAVSAAEVATPNRWCCHLRPARSKGSICRSRRTPPDGQSAVWAGGYQEVCGSLHQAGVLAGCRCHRSLPLQGVHTSAWEAWHKNRLGRMWHDDRSVSVNRSLAKLFTVHPCRLPYQSRPETDALARRAQERAAAELYAYQQQAPVEAADLEQRPVYEWVCVQSYSQYVVVLLPSASSITDH